MTAQEAGQAAPVSYDGSMTSSSVSERWSELPGSDMVDRGLNDLAAGEETVPVRMAAPRLRGWGWRCPETTIRAPRTDFTTSSPPPTPRGAHGAYNALVGRMVSFARAAERAGAG